VVERSDTTGKTPRQNTDPGGIADNPQSTIPHETLIEQTNSKDESGIPPGCKCLVFRDPNPVVSLRSTTG